MNNHLNCSQAFEQLSAISFAMDDLRLYLDTHPFDKEALKKFEDFQTDRNSMLTEYENSHGPVCAYNVKNNRSNFAWVDEPWPWEGIQ